VEYKKFTFGREGYGVDQLGNVNYMMSFHALLENDFINSDNKWKVQIHYKGIQQKQLSKGGFLQSPRAFLSLSLQGLFEPEPPGPFRA